MLKQSSFQQVGLHRSLVHVEAIIVAAAGGAGLYGRVVVSAHGGTAAVLRLGPVSTRPFAL